MTDPKVTPPISASGFYAQLCTTNEALTIRMHGRSTWQKAGFEFAEAFAAHVVATLEAENAQLRDWMRCANEFTWSHERTCPRRNSDATCTCGLDEFLCRPRHVIKSFRQENTALKARVEELLGELRCMSVDFHIGPVARKWATDALSRDATRAALAGKEHDGSNKT